jgi:ribulose-phosphate 3-epimerase
MARLGEEIIALQEAGSDRIHWDVMDGVFVPNLTIGPHVIAATRDLVTIPFEAHLMVADPDPLMHLYVEAGCETVIVHAETCRHLHRTLGVLRELGTSPAVALNPATPPEAVREVLDLVDMVLVMTVNPGFGGQRYIASMEPKIATLRNWILDAGLSVDIEVDGGLSPDTVAAATACGANVIVAGSAVFNHPEGRAFAIESIRSNGRATATAAAAQQ